ncbi:MAG: helix-turn-helix domain-containing protein [Dorea sp.]|jgi:Uma2 family endonuclease|nr:helix-turn-helix domain-containing protein [Dorea sp.]
MTISEMRKRKKELGYTNEKVSELSGVPLGTVQKIFAGVTDSPRYDTLQALEKVFVKEWNMLRESVAAFQVKRQGEYTLEDYYALPDERRIELIDGVIYDMSSPTSAHQMLATEIWQPLKDYIRKKEGDCVPIVSPIDVQLDCDDKTMLQPDVLVVCDRGKIIRRCIYGAPDFIVEILSPATRKKDMTVKLGKYVRAGVSEYWIVDPDKKKVVVYDFAHEEFPAVYGFDSKIPVGIFDGECVVDFAEIYQYISFLYEQ